MANNALDIDTTATSLVDDSGQRPVGVVTPKNENVLRANQAFIEDRIVDAERILLSLNNTSLMDRSWKLLLQAKMAMARGHLASAEPLALQASSLALIANHTVEGTSNTDHLRLTALALCTLGRIFRRQERPTHAVAAHRTAHDLLERYGSHEERWEAVTALGLDHDVVREYEEAQRWHRVALELAPDIHKEPKRRMAQACSHLAASLLESEDFEEAVRVSRDARELWRQYDITAATTATADLALGTTLLRHGQSLFDGNTELMKTVLTEARHLFEAADEALSAFGQSCAADIKTCREQLDLTQRLLAS